MSDGVRIGICTAANKVDAIVCAFAGTAYTGEAADGLIAVLPADKAHNITRRSETVPSRSRR